MSLLGQHRNTISFLIIKVLAQVLTMVLNEHFRKGMEGGRKLCPKLGPL